MSNTATATAEQPMIMYWETDNAVDITFGGDEAVEQALEVKKEALVSAIKEKYENKINELEESVLYDPLTNLKNDRCFLQDIEVYTPEHSALISFDVNYLKIVNDTYGHDKGDVLLKTVANQIKKHFGDNTYHIHGDEFNAIVPDEPENIKISIDAFRKELATQYIGVKDFTITCAIGVCHGNSDMSFDDMSEIADAAMYTNKRAIKQFQPQSINVDEIDIPRGADFIVQTQDNKITPINTNTPMIDYDTNYYEQADINMAKQNLIKSIIWNGAIVVVLSAIYIGINIFIA